MPFDGLSFDDGSHAAMVRRMFERQYLDSVGKERFASDPWNAYALRYNDAKIRRNWKWFEAGYKACAKNVRSI